MVGCRGDKPFKNEFWVVAGNAEIRDGGSGGLEHPNEHGPVRIEYFTRLEETGIVNKFVTC